MARTTSGKPSWRLVRARRDVLPASVRRWYRGSASRSGFSRFAGRAGARVKAGGRRWWLTAALVLVIGGAAAFVLLATPLLAVREISVTGAVIAGADRVRTVAGVELGTPLARVDADEVVARVEALPSVAAVDVSRSWPSTLVIAVTERTPVAVVTSGNQFLVLDGDGVVFNRVATRPPGAVLLAVAKPAESDPTTRAGLTVIGALTPGLREVLKRVVADTPDDIRLELTDGRTIIWGDASQSAKKAQAATALLGRASNRIDVSAPDVLVVS